MGSYQCDQCLEWFVTFVPTHNVNYRFKKCTTCTQTRRWSGTYTYVQTGQETEDNTQFREKMERVRDASLDNTMHGNEITREDAMNIPKK